MSGVKKILSYVHELSKEARTEIQFGDDMNNILRNLYTVILFPGLPFKMFSHLISKIC
jgi:hypothetical protein